MKRHLDRPGWLLVMAVGWATNAALLALSVYWAVRAKNPGNVGMCFSLCCFNLIVASRYLARYRKESEGVHFHTGIRRHEERG